MQLKHCTQLILDLINVIDQGARTDPYETWHHVLAADLFTWLPPQFKELDINFLFAFERGAIWQDEGLEILFALSEGRIVKFIHRDKNGLCMLLRMVTFLIDDNFQSIRIERKMWSESAGGSIFEGGKGLWDT